MVSEQRSSEGVFSEQALFELTVHGQAGSSQAMFERTAFQQVPFEKIPSEQTSVEDPIRGHTVFQ